MNWKDIIDRLLYTEMGQLFISVLLGLSLALLFRRVCKENCIRYIAPKYKEIEGKIFKLEDTCYNYSIENVKCNNEPILYYNGNLTPDNEIREKNFFEKIFA